MPQRGARLARRNIDRTTPEDSMPAAAPPNSRSSAGEGDDLAIKNYRQLTIAQVCGRLDGLSPSELQQLRQFEVQHSNRKGMLRALDRRIALTTRQA
jgi:hypothetical protein